MTAERPREAAHAAEMIANQEPLTVGCEKRAVDVAVENRGVVLARKDRDVIQRPLDPCGARRITDLTEFEVASDVVDEKEVVENDQPIDAGSARVAEAGCAIAVQYLHGGTAARSERDVRHARDSPNRSRARGS